MAQDRLANDKDFLMWVRNRMVNLFGDDPNNDWIKRLEDMSIFLPGPTLIPLTTAEYNSDYMRIPTWRLQDLGQYCLIDKGDLEPMRQYQPYKQDPELAERQRARQELVNRRRNEEKDIF